MNPYQFSLLFFGFCAFFISLLIWLKRQDDVGRIYLVFSTIVTLWACFFCVMISENVGYDTALLASRTLNTVALFIPVTWFHFTVIFTGNYQKQKSLLLTLYLCTAIVACFTPTALFVRSVAPMVGFPRLSEIGPAFHLFTALFFTVVPLGFVQLYKRIKLESCSERSQLLGLTWATFFGFLGASPTFLPSYGIMFPQYGLFLLPIYPFLMAYFMIRKNLFSEQEMAQAAHRNKLAVVGTLAASINHEIKNPLYVIQGLSESFLANRNAGCLGSDGEIAAVEVITKAGEQVRRAIDIMKNFLSFARYDGSTSGQQVADLKKVIESILPLMSHELQIDRVRFEMEIPTNLKMVKVDARHLEEILFNLIINSCQAMKESGGSIHLKASQNCDATIIEIRDTGPGISGPQLKKIFAPFYTTKVEGTGLGLFIVKQLVEKNGGMISVESEPGKGTRFILEFSR